MPKAEIEVAVEKVIHDGIRKIVQAISDEHGIQVNSFGVEWIDVSTVGERKFIVSTVSVDSSSS